MSGDLYLVATPIGNLSDISERARRILTDTTVIACEDTRTTRSLFMLLGLKTEGKKWIAYHNFNESEKLDEVVSILKQGEDVALVSDAGCPLISDPGYKLVHQCVEEEISVFPVPGANAVLSALQVSGLPTDCFFFAGFLPPKQQARHQFLESIKQIPSTLVFYESPKRVSETLAEFEQILGNRKMALVREITKKFEEKIYGTCHEVKEIIDGRPPLKGEVVLVVDRPFKEEINAADVENRLKELLKTKSVKEAVREIGSLCPMKKSDIYRLALEIKNE